MKLQLLILLSLFFLDTNGQIQKKFNDLEKGKLNDCVQEIISILDGYKLYKVDSSRRDLITYVYSNDQDDELQIHFEPKIIGADPDLKITGTKVYSLKKIFGQFITMDKIYRGYFGRNYDQALARKEGRDRFEVKIDNETHLIDFARYESAKGYWLLRIF